jgi:dTDP-4-dehydrorhamnose reductase
MTQNILILGSSGMLGEMCSKTLVQNNNFKVIGASRTRPSDQILSSLHWWYQFDIDQFEIEEFVNIIKDQEINYIINAIGITKPFIDENSISSRNNAILINSVFPSMLANTVEEFNIQILQIATDCVYSGNTTGFYTESSPHDTTDVYGKTKSLGEISHPNIHHLRCSIIGPEPTKKAFLLEWFLNQPQNAEISGFKNHIWNGITTYHFAKICEGIIENNIELPHLQHIVPYNNILGSGWTPADAVDKYRLLQMFAKYYNRSDIVINPIMADKSISRAISTENIELNQKLWQAAKYTGPPSIELMIEEMSNIQK